MSLTERLSVKENSWMNLPMTGGWLGGWVGGWGQGRLKKCTVETEETSESCDRERMARGQQGDCGLERTPERETT